MYHFEDHEHFWADIFQRSQVVQKPNVKHEQAECKKDSSWFLSVRY